MTVKNLVGNAVALTTAACLITALPAAAQTTEPTGSEPTAVTTAGTASSVRSAVEKAVEKASGGDDSTDSRLKEAPTGEASGNDGGDEQPLADAPGAGEIAKRYESLPAGVQNRVGAPIAEEVVVSDWLRYRDYEHARFYWTPEYGVHIIGGAILDRYMLLGAHNVLGVPTTDELATADGVARYNDFVDRYTSVRSSIYWTPDTGARFILGLIRDHWLELGGGSALGYPTTGSRVTPDDVGLYNHFNGAGGSSIYYTQSHGANAVQGAIRDKWAASGWERGPLGYPTTDELTTTDGVGRYNEFTGSGSLRAMIVWSPDTGAHSVLGKIALRYGALGGPNGVLGYPTTDEMTTPDGRGRYNHFSGSGGASVYWTPSTGAHEIYGAIRDHWAALGWERSYLGYPTTGELSAEWGRYNEFEGGSIAWNSTTGEVVDQPW